MKPHILITPIFRFFLTRRYRVSVKGAELLEIKGAKLVLPNHPAQIDAQLLGAITNKHWDIVPVISERFLKIPVVGYFLKAMDAIPVSDLGRGSRNSNVLEEILSGSLAALQENKSVVIYPAGSIKLQAEEKIRNKKSTYYLAQQFPDNAEIIGVRISGLWGSMWSVAWKGRKPKFGLTFLKSIFYVFANLIFFMPKRDVCFEFVNITEDVKEASKKDKKEFNLFLEEFYNVEGPEKAKFIRHYFFLPLIKPKGSIE